MAFDVSGTTITMTRGDTFRCQFPMYVGDEIYSLKKGDVVRFAVKKDYEDVVPCIRKTLSGYTLQLDPEDTKALQFGKHYYDVQITFADGTVATYITKGIFNIDKEVH